MTRVARPPRRPSTLAIRSRWPVQVPTRDTASALSTGVETRTAKVAAYRKAFMSSLHASMGLFGLDAGRADDLCPFLGIVDDELAEISGRAGKRLRAQIVEPGLVFGFGQPGVDRTVELVDDVCRGALWRADSLPADALVTGQEVADGRKVRQQLRPRRAGHRQCPHRTRLDLLAPSHDGAEHDLDPPGDELGYRRAIAAIVHSHH